MYCRISDHETMTYRFLFTSLFLAGGALFFILAAINTLGSRETIPLEEVTSRPNAPIKLKKLTSRPLGMDSATQLRSADVLSFTILPANYGCGTCSQRAQAFLKALESHPSFENLTVRTSALIAESDRRVAEHFMKIQQLNVPVFQTTTVPVSGDSPAGPCFALLIDPQTETAFFKVHLARATVTKEHDAIFDTARQAYRERTR